MLKTKEEVLGYLVEIGYDREFVVTFIKKDGEIRTMYAKMPPPDKPNFGEVNLITVWDTLKDAWRCFDPSRVMTITKV